MAAENPEPFVSGRVPRGFVEEHGRISPQPREERVGEPVAELIQIGEIELGEVALEDHPRPVHARPLSRGHEV
jgi:hypothetical protein